MMTMRYNVPMFVTESSSLDAVTLCFCLVSCARPSQCVLYFKFSARSVNSSDVFHVVVLPYRV